MIIGEENTHINSQEKKLSINKYQSQIQRQLNLENRVDALSKKECHLVLKLVNLASCELNWAKVIELTSQTILVGCGPLTTLYLYRYWIEALHRTHDRKSLSLLGLHLLKQRKSSHDALALALTCFTLSERFKIAQVIYKRLKNKSIKSYYTYEANSLFILKFCKSQNKQIGLNTLIKLVEKKSSHYCTYLQTLEFSNSLKNYESHALTYRLLRNRYRYSPYPYFASAVLAIEDKDYPSGLFNLKLIKNKILKNLELEMLNCQCLLECGEYKLAERNFKRVLKQNPNGLHWQDYAIGSKIYQKLWDRYKYNEYKNKSLAYLNHAKELSKNLNIGNGWFYNLETTFSEDVKVENDKNRQVWLAFASQGVLDEIIDKNSLSILSPSDCKKGDKIIFCKAEEENIQNLEVRCLSNVHGQAQRHNVNNWFSVIKNDQYYNHIQIPVNEIFSESTGKIHIENLLNNQLLGFVKISLQQTETILSHLRSPSKLSLPFSRTG